MGSSVADAFCEFAGAKYSLQDLHALGVVVLARVRVQVVKSMAFEKRQEGFSITSHGNVLRELPYALFKAIQDRALRRGWAPCGRSGRRHACSRACEARPLSEVMASRMRREREMRRRRRC